MAKHFSKTKDIMAVDLSHPETRLVYHFINFSQLCEQLQLSRYKMRDLISGEKTEIIMRSSKTNILYKISIESKIIAHARPERFEYEEIDFTSVSNCIKFFGIGPYTYYRRLDSAPLGEEVSKPIKDKDGVKWYLTFFKDARTFKPQQEEVKFIPEEEW